MPHLSLRWKMSLAQTCRPWILVMPPIFTTTCPILRTSRLQISSQELILPVTSLNIFTCGVVLSMSCIPSFNKFINSRNGSHDLIAVHFFGFSSNHSSDIPLILKTDTGHIPPQFHVIFDDYFSIVLYFPPEEEPTSFWNELDINDFIYLVLFNDNPQASLDSEWITYSEID